MMASGLLGLSEDPQTMGLLSLGLRLMSSPDRRFSAALGKSGLGALSDVQQAQALQEQRRRQALQEASMKQQMESGALQQQMLGLQLGDARRQSELAALPGRFSAAPSSPGMDATGGMETALEAPNNRASPMGRFDQAGYINAVRGIAGPEEALRRERLLAKPAAEVKSRDPTHDLYTLGPDGMPRVVLPGQAKKEADKPTDDMREFAYAISRGEVPQGQSFTEWMRANKKAGATSVSVSTGQKGYENESKLRNDFKSEPIYKDFSDMQQAHKQVKAGLAAGNPIGDVTAATKMMKLIDPGSVVRESELGIAMAAAGKMDRFKNFAEMQIKGTKLTPTQREEFGRLADELMTAAGAAYNQKRGEYAQMGGRYKLDPTSLGAPWAPIQMAPSAGGGWSIKPKP